MQVDYKSYSETYGGKKIPEDDWKRLSQKAGQRLNHFTFGRLPDRWEGEPWEECARFAVCEMAEILFDEERRSGKTSENTDGYSVSFDTSVSVTANLYEIAYSYLGNTGLMDFGVDEEC